MPTKVFTDRWLKSLKTDKVQEEYSDSSFNERGAFTVIVSRTGRKTFYHRYLINGKKKRDMLGTYPSMSLAKARERAIDNVSKLNDGEDPAALRKSFREAETFGELAKLFFERSEDKLSPSTLENYQKIYSRDLKIWEDRKARSIRKADVIYVLEHICYERNAPTKSNRTYELISRIFNFGISREIVETNPVQGLEKLGEEKRGERVFSQDEIKRFWLATDKQRPHIRGIFRLLLLTGQRPGEIQSIEWDHIDKDILTIPSANSKNKRRHQIHLTKLALHEIELMRPHSGSRKYVFSIYDRDEPIHFLTKGCWAILVSMDDLAGNGANKKKAKQPKTKSRANPQLKHIKPWTPRDIRRTVQTRMAEMGIRPDVVDRVLNHNVAGVRRHYDHYSYYPEIREALIRWGEKLLGVLAEDN